MPDNDAVSRAEDARLANEARVAALALVKSREDREAFWDRLGCNVRTEDGIEELGKAIAWSKRAQQRAATLGKRLLGWVTFIITVAGFLFEGIKFYIEIRKPNG